MENIENMEKSGKNGKKCSDQGKFIFSRSDMFKCSVFLGEHATSFSRLTNSCDSQETSEVSITIPV